MNGNVCVARTGFGLNKAARLLSLLLINSPTFPEFT